MLAVKESACQLWLCIPVDSSPQGASPLVDWEPQLVDWERSIGALRRPNDSVYCAFVLCQYAVGVGMHQATSALAVRVAVARLCLVSLGFWAGGSFGEIFQKGTSSCDFLILEVPWGTTLDPVG